MGEELGLREGDYRYVDIVNNNFEAVGLQHSVLMKYEYIQR